MKSRCPRCLDRDIHKSRLQSPIDLLRLFVLRRPVRCYSCMLRFSEWIFIKVLPRQTVYDRYGKRKSVA